MLLLAVLSILSILDTKCSGDVVVVKAKTDSFFHKERLFKVRNEYAHTADLLLLMMMLFVLTR